MCIRYGRWCEEWKRGWELVWVYVWDFICIEGLGYKTAFCIRSHSEMMGVLDLKSKGFCRVYMRRTPVVSIPTTLLGFTCCEAWEG